MKKQLAAVTGFFGAPIWSVAQDIVLKEDRMLCDLDEFILQDCGWTVQRLVMMHGEHAYRNKEYEILSDIAKSDDPCVVACGDGVLYDEGSLSILKQGDLYIAGYEISTEDLWMNALNGPASYHAFMNFGTYEERHAAFEEFIERQRVLFRKVAEEANVICV